MGVLNLTPDSFSDGGIWEETDLAVERALALVRQGADMLDLGAESTRPGGGVYGDGAATVSAEQEIDRLLPVLTRVRDRISVPISVDTRKGVVAERALVAGADLINDISALEDPRMGETLAAASAPVVLMHSRGSLPSMQRNIDFTDVVAEVTAELASSVERAIEAGIDEEQIVIDPGIGFGKTQRQNLELLRNLNSLERLGRPVLVGASRKSFIGEIAGAKPDRRLGGSLGAVAWAARHQAAIVRVHDVEDTVQFLDVWSAIASARRTAP